MVKIKFKEWDCVLQFHKYNNDRTALMLVDEYDGSPVAVATINIPNEDLGKDEVVIKDYTENEGMLDTLIDAGIISNPVAYIKTGYVNSPICKLLVNE